jgi:hypothetical protein
LTTANTLCCFTSASSTALLTFESSAPPLDSASSAVSAPMLASVLRFQPDASPRHFRKLSVQPGQLYERARYGLTSVVAVQACIKDIVFLNRTSKRGTGRPGSDSSLAHKCRMKQRATRRGESRVGFALCVCFVRSKAFRRTEGRNCILVRKDGTTPLRARRLNRWRRCCARATRHSRGRARSIFVSAVAPTRA